MANYPIIAKLPQLPQLNVSTVPVKINNLNNTLKTTLPNLKLNNTYRPAPAKSYILNYDDPFAINSLLDAVNPFVVANKYGWLGYVPGVSALVGAGDLLWNGTINPAIHGAFGAVAVNALSDFGEVLDIVANPVKGLLMEGPEGFVKALGFNPYAGRVNYNWDTGNWAQDFALEVMTDPLNWVSLGGKAALSSGAKGIVKSSVANVAKDVGKEFAEDSVTALAKKASKIYIENMHKGMSLPNALQLAVEQTDLRLPKVLQEAYLKNYLKDTELLKTFRPYVQNIMDDAVMKKSVNLLSGLNKIVNTTEAFDKFIFKAGTFSNSIGITWTLLKQTKKLDIVDNFLTKLMEKTLKPFIKNDTISFTKLPYILAKSSKVINNFRDATSLADDLADDLKSVLLQTAVSSDIKSFNHIIKPLSTQLSNNLFLKFPVPLDAALKEVFDDINKYIRETHGISDLDAYITWLQGFNTKLGGTVLSQHIEDLKLIKARLDDLSLNQNNLSELYAKSAQGLQEIFPTSIDVTNPAATVQKIIDLKTIPSEDYASASNIINEVPLANVVSKKQKVVQLRKIAQDLNTTVELLKAVDVLYDVPLNRVTDVDTAVKPLLNDWEELMHDVENARLLRETALANNRPLTTEEIDFLLHDDRFYDKLYNKIKTKTEEDYKKYVQEQEYIEETERQFNEKIANEAEQQRIQAELREKYLNEVDSFFTQHPDEFPKLYDKIIKDKIFLKPKKVSSAVMKFFTDYEANSKASAVLEAILRSEAYNKYAYEGIMEDVEKLYDYISKNILSDPLKLKPILKRYGLEYDTALAQVINEKYFSRSFLNNYVINYVIEKLNLQEVYDAYMSEHIKYFFEYLSTNNVFSKEFSENLQKYSSDPYKYKDYVKLMLRETDYIYTVEKIMKFMGVEETPVVQLSDQIKYDLVDSLKHSPNKLKSKLAELPGGEEFFRETVQSFMDRDHNLLADFYIKNYVPRETFLEDSILKKIDPVELEKFQKELKEGTSIFDEEPTVPKNFKLLKNLKYTSKVPEEIAQKLKEMNNISVFTKSLDNIAEEVTEAEKILADNEAEPTALGFFEDRILQLLKDLETQIDPETGSLLRQITPEIEERVQKMFEDILLQISYYAPTEDSLSNKLWKAAVSTYANFFGEAALDSVSKKVAYTIQLNKIQARLLFMQDSLIRQAFADIESYGRVGAVVRVLAGKKHYIAQDIQMYSNIYYSYHNFINGILYEKEMSTEFKRMFFDVLENYSDYSIDYMVSRADNIFEDILERMQKLFDNAKIDKQISDVERAKAYTHFKKYLSRLSYIDDTFKHTSSISKKRFLLNFKDVSKSFREFAYTCRDNLLGLPGQVSVSTQRLIDALSGINDYFVTVSDNIDKTLYDVKSFNNKLGNLVIYKEDLESGLDPAYMHSDAKTIMQLLAEISDDPLTSLSAKRVMDVPVMAKYFEVPEKLSIDASEYFYEAASFMTKEDDWLKVRDVFNNVDAGDIAHTKGILDNVINFLVSFSKNPVISVQLKNSLINDESLLNRYFLIRYLFINRAPGTDYKKFINNLENLCNEEHIIFEYITNPNILRTSDQVIDFYSQFQQPTLFTEEAKTVAAYKLETDRQILAMSASKASLEQALETMHRSMGESNFLYAKTMSQYKYISHLLDLWKAYVTIPAAVQEQLGRKELKEFLNYIAQDGDLMHTQGIYNILRKTPEDLLSYLIHQCCGVCIVHLPTDATVADILINWLKKVDQFEKLGILVHYSEGRLCLALKDTPELIESYKKIPYKKLTEDLPDLPMTDTPVFNEVRKGASAIRKLMIDVSDGASIASNGIVAIEEDIAEAFKALPMNMSFFALSLEKYKTMFPEAFDKLRFNHSVWGNAKQVRKIYPKIFSHNYLKNYASSIQTVLSRLDIQTKQVSMFFTNEFNINASRWLAGIPDEDLINFFRNTDDIKVALLNERANKSGFVLKELKITDKASLDYARENYASFFPLHVYNELFKSINKFEITNKWLKFWQRAVVTPTKTMYLASIGTVFRNLIDSPIRSFLTTNDIARVPEYMSHLAQTTKLYMNYLDVQRELLKLDDTKIISDKIKKIYFEEKRKMSRELYEFIDKFISEGPSAGLSKTYREALEEAGYFDKAQRGLWEEIVLNKVSSGLLDMFSLTEQINRLSTFTWEILNGNTAVSAAKSVVKAHFDYGVRSALENYVDLVIPFISFKMKIIDYWLDVLMQNAWLIPILGDAVNTTLHDYSPEELNMNKSLQYNILAGNIILNENTGLTLKASFSLYSVLNTLTNPIDETIGSVYPAISAPINITKNLLQDNTEAATNELTSALPVVGPTIQRYKSGITNYERSGNMLTRALPGIFGAVAPTYTFRPYRLNRFPVHINKTFANNARAKKYYSNNVYVKKSYVPRNSAQTVYSRYYNKNNTGRLYNRPVPQNFLGVKYIMKF